MKTSRPSGQVGMQGPSPWQPLGASLDNPQVADLMQSRLRERSVTKGVVLELQDCCHCSGRQCKDQILSALLTAQHSCVLPLPGLDYFSRHAGASLSLQSYCLTSLMVASKSSVQLYVLYEPSPK